MGTLKSPWWHWTLPAQTSSALNWGVENRFNESGSWHSDNCGGPCLLSGHSEDSSISPAKWKLCGLKPQVFSYQKHFPKHGNEATWRRKLDGVPAAEHARRFLEGFGKWVSRGSSAHVGCMQCWGAFAFAIFPFLWQMFVYGNMIFNSLKAHLSGVDSSFEVIIFCVMLSGQLDSQVKHYMSQMGEIMWAFCMPFGHKRRSLQWPERMTRSWVISKAHRKWSLAVLCHSSLASNLILSQIHKYSEEPNNSDFLLCLCPVWWTSLDTYKEQNCKFTWTLRVLDTVVGQTARSCQCRNQRRLEHATC